MDKNVGHYDRVIRIGLGVGLLIVGVLGLAGLFGPSGSTMLAAGVLIIVIGAVLAVTGLTQSCPLYSVAGISTSQE